MQIKTLGLLILISCHHLVSRYLATYVLCLGNILTFDLYQRLEDVSTDTLSYCPVYLSIYPFLFHTADPTGGSLEYIPGDLGQKVGDNMGAVAHTYTQHNRFQSACNVIGLGKKPEYLTGTPQSMRRKCKLHTCSHHMFIPIFIL